MNGSCLQLFNYTMRQITPNEVAMFAPRDPGYDDYVRAFTKIIETGALPHEATFDITETISLTQWTDPAEIADPIRFRRFRTFTTSVGLAMRAVGYIPFYTDVLHPNYLAIGLITDAYALGDSALFALLDPAFDEFHAILVRNEPDESPFLLLARILLAFMGHGESGQITHLAEQLLVEESRHAGFASDGFLWGCTFFDQMNGEWKVFIDRFLAPSNPELKLLRDALLT